MPPIPSRLDKMFGVPVRWAGLLLAATLALICIAFALLLWNARIAERQKASTAASNLSAALTQDIARSIELYDLSIRGVIEVLGNPAVMSTTPDLRQLILFDRATAAPYLGSLRVLDEHGNARFESSALPPLPFNYADRSYFKAQASRPDLGLYVSEPFQTKADQEWVISLSRRVNKPDGSFGGVVAGSLRLQYFLRLFSRMKLGKGGSLTLFRNDGAIIMREPFDPALLGRVIKAPALFDRLAEAPEGEYEAKSLVDGVDRLYHYQQVGDLPLVQNVALSIEELYADWWRKAVEVSAVLATCCLIIITLAFFLRTELRRRLQAEDALVALAGEDPLTQLANRRRFDNVIDEEFRRAVRHAWPIALLIIDADHFKSYNDTFGHRAGDAALVALAECLRRRTQRSGNLAARYGGEEFAVVFPHTGSDDALRLAEAIRLDVLGLRLPAPGSSHSHFSVSLGIVSVTPVVGDSAADLIETADRALNTSKAEGRNRSTLRQSLTARAGTRVALSIAS